LDIAIYLEGERESFVKLEINVQYKIGHEKFLELFKERE
jgi:hypothetical protein